MLAVAHPSPASFGPPARREPLCGSDVPPPPAHPTRDPEGTSVMRRWDRENAGASGKTVDPEMHVWTICPSFWVPEWEVPLPPPFSSHPRRRVPLAPQRALYLFYSHTLRLVCTSPTECPVICMLCPVDGTGDGLPLRIGLLFVAMLFLVCGCSLTGCVS